MDDVAWSVDDELLATLGVSEEEELSLHERLALCDALCRRWESGE